MNERNWQIWQGSFDVVQVVGAPTPVGLNLTFNDAWGELLVYRIIAGTLGASRSITLNHDDDDAPGSFQLLESLSFGSGGSLHGPSVRASQADSSASAINQTGVPYAPYIIPSTHRLSLRLLSLANTETFTFKILMKMFGRPPTATIVGAGLTIVTNFDEVV